MGEAAVYCQVCADYLAGTVSFTRRKINFLSRNGHRQKGKHPSMRITVSTELQIKVVRGEAMKNKKILK
jgi:hypothetical protein